MRRLKLSEKVDLFTGVISSGNTPALGPVAEELKCLTLFTDGCTDFLFEKAVPNPHYVFRLTNIQSADGVVAAIAASTAWPKATKIAHIHPDYSYGRNAFDHFNIAMRKLSGNIEVVSEAWPKLGTTEFTAHITKTISSKPDLLFCSVWGGDYVAFYKQALRYDLFKKTKMATTPQTSPTTTPASMMPRQGCSSLRTRVTAATTNTSTIPETTFRRLVEWTKPRQYSGARRTCSGRGCSARWNARATTRGENPRWKPR